MEVLGAVGRIRKVVKALLVRRDANWFLVRQLPLLLVRVSSTGDPLRSTRSNAFRDRTNTSPRDLWEIPRGRVVLLFSVFGLVVVSSERS